MRLRLDTYQPLYFDVGAKVPSIRATSGRCRASIRAALVDAFSFERARFAQSVSLAEVVRVLHSVAGVVFVDVDTLAALRPDVAGPARQAACSAPRASQWQDDEAEPGALAQLLLINPFGIALTPCLNSP